MIRFEKVSKSFPGTLEQAVVDCSLSVERGTLLVLVGPSGSGKTTLLKMANRLIEPTSGQVFFDGTEVRQLEVTALRRRIGYVIQQIGLFPHMTVAKNIAVVPELLGWSRERIQQRVDALLELVAMPPREFCTRYPSQLSGGQQQRVGLARALAADPDVLLMDEPFGALDALTRRDLQDALLHLQQRLRKTILFVTHDMDEALRLADRIVVLRAGRIVQDGAPLDLLASPKDRFVYDLVGADNVMRRLSLVPISALLEAHRLPASPALPEAPAISIEENLRSALSLLLSSGAPELAVTRAGEKIGALTLRAIQEVASLKDGYELHSR